MTDLALHHVAINVTDLDRSLAFYQDLFGLEQKPRPPFKVPGVWLAVGELQLHLIHYPDASFRGNPAIDISDWHFAFRTSDFEGFVARLTARGFREDLPEHDPMRLHVLRDSVAGFAQLYLRDPDHNIIEINAAPR